MHLQMLSPQADRMFYILFPRSHIFSAAEFNCFKNLQKLVAVLALLPNSSS